MNNVFELKVLVERLREALEKGWREFRESSDFVKLRKFAQFLETAGFYDSEFRESLPHPAYEYGARIIGKYVPSCCRHLDIHFACIFPGDFLRSREWQDNELMFRTFELDVLCGQKKVCTLGLSFSHCHDSYDFPETPRISVLRVFE